MAAPATWRHRHLLDVDNLSADDYRLIFDRARAMRTRREQGGGASLRGRTVALVFYEPSTRTRVSFELAARALGGEVVNVAVPVSSVEKGESLVDTLRTLERTGVSVTVLRHAAAGAPYLAARVLAGHVVNAGDGAHAHPTQALLDAFTLHERWGSLEGRKVAIVGDVSHSRVARSNLHALTALGASVWLAGPPTLVAGFEEWPGARVASLAEALRDADAVMALRIQRERADGSALPTAGEYRARWGLTAERLAELSPDTLVLHPGPANEGVEIDADVAAGHQSLIAEQVTNGVAIRMAILELIVG
jgi:aspartate carbamoyltransferase catalytic subunit